MLHVKGGERRRKVYFLTPKGQARAELLRKDGEIATADGRKALSIAMQSNNEIISEARRYAEVLDTVIGIMNGADAERIAIARSNMKEVLAEKLPYYQEVEIASKEKGDLLEEAKAQASIRQIKRALENSS